MRRYPILQHRDRLPRFARGQSGEAYQGRGQKCNQRDTRKSMAYLLRLKKDELIGVPVAGTR
jgi:hypothetical protein